LDEPSQDDASVALPADLHVVRDAETRLRMFTRSPAVPECAATISSADVMPTPRITACQHCT